MCEIKDSGWIGIAMDQLLEPDTGRLFNDEAAAVAAKSESREKAAKAIQDSFAKKSHLGSSTLPVVKDS